MNTTVQILIVGATTIIMLLVIMAAARRRQSFWWVSFALIAASGASLALGAYFAVRSFMSTIEEMAKTGGGIASVRFGIWQATQPALAAAWIALVIALLASVVVLPRARKELAFPAGAPRPRFALFASLAGLALAAGVTSMFLFRRAIAFVLWAIVPRARVDSISEAIATRLSVTATASAACFVVLVLLTMFIVLLARKSSPSRLFTITLFALVVSLGLSAALVTDLRSFSDLHHRGAISGGVPLK